MVTQFGEPSRILQNEQLATALGLDPSVAVLVVPKSHSEINKHLGSSADTSTMTSRVVDFIKRSSR